MLVFRLFLFFGIVSASIRYFPPLLAMGSSESPWEMGCAGSFRPLLAIDFSAVSPLQSSHGQTLSQYDSALWGVGYGGSVAEVSPWPVVAPLGLSASSPPRPSSGGLDPRVLGESMDSRRGVKRRLSPNRGTQPEGSVGPLGWRDGPCFGEYGDIESFIGAYLPFNEGGSSFIDGEFGLSAVSPLQSSHGQPSHSTTQLYGGSVAEVSPWPVVAPLGLSASSPPRPSSGGLDPRVLGESMDSRRGVKRRLSPNRGTQPEGSVGPLGWRDGPCFGEYGDIGSFIGAYLSSNEGGSSFIDGEFDFSAVSPLQSSHGQPSHDATQLYGGSVAEVSPWPVVAPLGLSVSSPPRPSPREPSHSTTQLYGGVPRPAPGVTRTDSVLGVNDVEVFFNYTRQFEALLGICCCETTPRRMYMRCAGRVLDFFDKNRPGKNRLIVGRNEKFFEKQDIQERRKFFSLLRDEDAFPKLKWKFWFYLAELSRFDLHRAARLMGQLGIVFENSNTDELAGDPFFLIQENVYPIHAALDRILSKEDTRLIYRVLSRKEEGRSGSSSERALLLAEEISRRENKQELLDRANGYVEKYGIIGKKGRLSLQKKNYLCCAKFFYGAADFKPMNGPLGGGLVKIHLNRARCHGGIWKWFAEERNVRDFGAMQEEKRAALSHLDQIYLSDTEENPLSFGDYAKVIDSLAHLEDWEKIIDFAKSFVSKLKGEAKIDGKYSKEVMEARDHILKACIKKGDKDGLMEMECSVWGGGRLSRKRSQLTLK